MPDAPLRARSPVAGAGCGQEHGLCAPCTSQFLHATSLCSYLRSLATRPLLAVPVHSPEHKEAPAPPRRHSLGLQPEQ